MMRRKRRGMMPEAKFLSDLPEHERHDPGDTYLKAQAVKYERENHPKDYRQMRDAGELDVYAGLKARATRSFVQTLISQGELPSHAWRRAMLVQIFERDEDLLPRATSAI